MVNTPSNKALFLEGGTLGGGRLTRNPYQHPSEAKAHVHPPEDALVTVVPEVPRCNWRISVIEEGKRHYTAENKHDSPENGYMVPGDPL